MSFARGSGGCGGAALEGRELAAGWLGTAFANALAEVGATVIMSSPSLERGQAAAAELPTPAGQTHLGVELNHMEEDSLLAGFAAAVEAAEADAEADAEVEPAAEGEPDAEGESGSDAADADVEPDENEPGPHRHPAWEEGPAQAHADDIEGYYQDVDRFDVL